MAKSVFDWGNFASGALSGFGSLLGSGIEAWSNQKANEENIKMQKEFAQNGIQWKVMDAQKAGIHPAVALGANTYQATPSSVGVSSGKGVSDAFKHFGSAINSYVEDKEEERNLQLENMRLQNEKEKVELENAKKKSSSDNSLNPNRVFVPSNGLDGVPNNAKLLFGQDKVTDDFNLTRTKDGTIVFTPSDAVSDYVSDSFAGSASWHKRNFAPDLDDNVYSDIYNRLVQLKQLNPFTEGLIHTWSPIEGNVYKIASKNSQEWKDYEKYGKYYPLALLKKLYNKPIDLTNKSTNKSSLWAKIKSFF